MKGSAGGTAQEKAMHVCESAVPLLQLCSLKGHTGKTVQQRQANVRCCLQAPSHP